jgi:hypothetical protein
MWGTILFMVRYRAATASTIDSNDRGSDAAKPTLTTDGLGHIADIRSESRNTPMNGGATRVACFENTVAGRRLSSELQQAAVRSHGVQDRLVASIV